MKKIAQPKKKQRGTKLPLCTPKHTCTTNQHAHHYVCAQEGGRNRPAPLARHPTHAEESTVQHCRPSHASKLVHTQGSECTKYGACDQGHALPGSRIQGNMHTSACTPMAEHASWGACSLGSALTLVLAPMGVHQGHVRPLVSTRPTAHELRSQAAPKISCNALLKFERIYCNSELIISLD